MANVHTSRRSGLILRGGRNIRETTWLGVPRITATMAASATAVLAASLNAAALSLRPFTVVRSRGQWWSRSDQSGATEDYVGNFGVAVVSEVASTVGVGSVPTPATEQDSDFWFVLEQDMGIFQLVGADVQSVNRSKTWDSKAMRKVDKDSDIVFVLEAGIGGQGVIAQFVGRMLIKLH